MTTVPQVATVLQTVLTTTAQRAAHTTGFIKRHRRLTGASFVQGLVFGWLAHPAATYDQLATAVTRAGTPISPQGLERRFSPEAAACLRQVLDTLVETVVSADPSAASLLSRFVGVWVLDSSTIRLPAALAARFPGSGKSKEQGETAGVKLHTGMDLRAGALKGPDLGPARQDDKASALQQASLPAGSVRLTDLGYYALTVLRSLG
jgi:hypothetical protein